MKVLLDACVLYPTVMREVLIKAAAAGLYTPLWSDRILEEWARAARKLGPGGEVQARGEIAMLQSQWPAASVPGTPGLEARLWLPDPADVHVLSSAIAGHADLIVTMNAKDFPRNILSEEGVDRIDPDGFMRQLHEGAPDQIAQVVREVHAEAERLSGEAWELRKLMKKARMPRLGKVLTA